MLFFKSLKKFQSHRRDCLNVNTNPSVFPDDDYIFFKNIKKQIRHNFICCNFESFLVPSNEGKIKGTIQTHKLFSVGLYIQSNFPELVESCYESRRGTDAGE